MTREATQPLEIMLVRHGQSQANVVQGAEKEGRELPDYADEVYASHDFQHPLTALGVRQAKMARAALLDQGIVPEEYFDEFYVSPYLRTVETMAYLTDGNVDPLPEVRLIERDWGLYGATPMQERVERFAHTEQRRAISSFYTRYDGGENVPDVIGRFRDWMGTLNREMTNRRVLAVVHGDLIEAGSYVCEGMSPDEWHERDEAKAFRIGNCAIYNVTRQNPADASEISRTLTGGWRRVIDPSRPERSVNGGEWERVGGRTRLLGAEILARAEARVRIGETPAIV